MFGQGRPLFGFPLPRRWASAGWIAALWLLAFASIATPIPAAALQPAVPAAMRIRVSWSLNQPTNLQATLRTQQATLRAPQNLCLSTGSTGGFRLRRDGHQLQFLPRGQAAFGGFDIVVEGDLQDSLELSLAASVDPTPGTSSAPQTAGQPVTRTVRLAELRSETVAFEIPGLGTVQVQRSPGDSIHADFQRDALVFWTSEQVPLQLRILPTAAVHAGETLETRMTVRAARGGRVVHKQHWSTPVDEQGQIAPLDAGPLTIPAQEGAYDIELVCVRPRGSALGLLKTDLRALRGETTVAARTVQVAAIAKQRPATAGEAFRPIGKIQPLRRTWSMPRLLPSVTAGLVASEEPVASGALGEELHAGEPIAVLGPAAWYASPLPVAELGRPHLLVIRYPKNQLMQLGVSVVQPDAGGNIPPLGTDTGVAASVVAGPLSGEPWAEHRVVFWPHHRRPYVVLTNHDSDEPVRFESIRVEAGPLDLASASLSSDAATLTTTAGGSTPATVTAAGTDTDTDIKTFSDASGAAMRSRLAALYLDKPLLAECFGDGGVLDQENGMVLEDWQTFLTAGQRLVDYLKWAGYNGAIVTVSSDGGTLYPSDLIQATPRFDNGVFSSRGHDPIRKDVLELLMRLCDREGLQLVPSVEWTTPIPQLERLLDDPQHDAGIQPVDFHQRPYRHDPTAQVGEVPYYNPLHPQVQAVLAAAVAELTQRYQGHRCFTGLGVHLGKATPMQLPPAQWTQDPLLVQRFLRQQSMAGGAATVPSEATALAQWLAAEGAESFAGWRAAQLTDFYRRLTAAVAGRRLLVLSADGSGSLSTSYSFGLDWQQLGAIDNLVPLRLIRESVFRDVVQQASDARYNESSKWDQQLATAKAAGALVFRPSLETRNPSLREHAPVAAGANRKNWYVHAVPDGQRYRHQLIRTLENVDAQVLAVGGWTAPLGQEQATREVLRTFALLPPQVMQPVPASGDESASIRVRQLVSATETFVSAVNPSPWPLTLDVQFGKPVSGQMISGQMVSGTDAGGRQAWNAPNGLWQVTLAPGQLAAIVLQGSAPVQRWREGPADGPQFTRQLADRVQELAARVAMLANSRIYPELRNGSFDESSERSIPGWMHAQHPPGCVQLASKGFDDDHCVTMNNDGTSSSKTWIVSAPFHPPATGRLAVSLQARCETSGSDPVQPALRVGIEGRVHGAPLRRSVTLTPQADGQWQAAPLWLEVEELGSEEIEELRLTIDLLTPGRVWIDNVQLHDFFLTQAERSRLQTQTFLAVQRIRHDDLTGAAKLFQSHWGRYLMSLRVPQPPPRGVPGAAAEPLSVPPEEPSPGIAERVRGWLPSPMRF
ncbi:family 10 glycosylhydrolase [Roseimaritima ulvae]|uniref:Glycosyl hydrolase-like 10 domain-containing protein n=1 Tax=Roseimaritima ulvae TaxID=980254 RepID=A0A5B9QSU6_9BACT|nr:family 10 glycosylhydrolase [Roseimaritima ulvae]QEG40136.1 hypothetical protein UC8_21420 [Roseimaritima ulvae]